MDEQFIIAVGSIADGLAFIGPFSDPSEAVEYASRKYSTQDWIVVALHQPEAAGY